MIFSGGRFKELIKKYGKVALGVHLSVSGATIAGLYVAIKSNADVVSIFNKLHLPGVPSKDLPPPQPDLYSETGVVIDETAKQKAVVVAKEKNLGDKTAELAATSGGAFALALLCNKALIPVRIPITIALTPPIARFLARRKILKTGV